MTSYLPLILAFTLSISCSPSGEKAVWPDPEWAGADPTDMGLDTARLEQARDYALTGGGSGMIIVKGYQVMAWGNPDQLYDLKSTTKSIGVTALGLALHDQLVKLDDKAALYHTSLAIPPESNADSGWIDEITLFQLATQTAGFDKPGGYEKLLFPPGTKWAYSDGGPNWLAECLTSAYRQDLRELLFERVFAPIGIQRKDLIWRTNAYRAEDIEGIRRREFGSGIKADVDAMARIGYLYLRKGTWKDRQLLPEEFVDRARTRLPGVVGLPVVNDPGNRHARASNHYGLLWWNNADGSMPTIPRDAFWSAGLYDSFIIVIPSLDLVVVRAGKGWPGERSPSYYRILEPFIKPVVEACLAVSSRRIRRIEWAAPATVVRRAEGSDNWPITWGTDGHLYTAYGDGWGFEPKVQNKLSLGFARIEGGPADFVGINIRSDTGEQYGDGQKGIKASGLLMLEGTLYLWARNANHHGEYAQLAWSTDGGTTWTWSPWVVEELGYPVFLNFGPNYAGSRDKYVYFYSPDTPSAYRETDNVILARVPQNRLREKEAYEYFVARDDHGGPVWSRDINKRGAVFSLAGGCNRLSVVYNAGIERYLMTMRSRGVDGGRNQFSIYEAAEPWGPWQKVYYTEDWDMDPGEAQQIPAKWISPDGRTIHLVFSGDDTFSVRKGTLIVSE